jgi:hypothetical protein
VGGEAEPVDHHGERALGEELAEGHGIERAARGMDGGGVGEESAVEGEGFDGFRGLEARCAG